MGASTTRGALPARGSDSRLFQEQTYPAKLGSLTGQQAGVGSEDGMALHLQVQPVGCISPALRRKNHCGRSVLSALWGQSPATFCSESLEHLEQKDLKHLEPSLDTLEHADFDVGNPSRGLRAKRCHSASESSHDALVFDPVCHARRKHQSRRHRHRCPGPKPQLQRKKGSVFLRTIAPTRSFSTRFVTRAKNTELTSNRCNFRCVPNALPSIHRIHPANGRKSHGCDTKALHEARAKQQELRQELRGAPQVHQEHRVEGDVLHGRLRAVDEPRRRRDPEAKARHALRERRRDAHPRRG